MLLPFGIFHNPLISGWQGKAFLSTGVSSISRWIAKKAE